MRIKTDRSKNYIEVEGNEEFIKEFVEKQCKFFDENKLSYTEERNKLSWVLGAIICIFSVMWLFKFWPLSFITSFLFEFMFIFAMGLFGLLVRNFIFMSNGVEEKEGKKIYLAYVAYSIFIFFSSILIYGIFKDNWFLAIPLNFYIGLFVYSVVDLLIRLINKVF